MEDRFGHGESQSMWGLEFSKVCHYPIEYCSDQFELLLHQTYLLVALQLYNVCLEAGK